MPILNPEKFKLGHYRLLGSYADFRAEPMAEAQKVGRTRTPARSPASLEVHRCFLKIADVRE